MEVRAKLEEAVRHQLEGRADAAEALYREVLAHRPDNADAKHLLGVILADRDDYDASLALIEEAISTNPGAAPYHHNLAGILRRMGRLEDAESRFREAIRLKPDYGEAFQGLAELKRLEPNDPMVVQLEQQLSRQDLDRQARCYLHFAAGKIHDDNGNYETAFEHFRAGNAAAGRTFDNGAFRSRVKDTIYIYSRGYTARRGRVGCTSDLPVFIVGMPRSGTSLVEQILASHSQIFGAGELNDIKAIVRRIEELAGTRTTFPNYVPRLEDRLFKGFGEAYVARVGTLVSKPGVTRIVDKHPLNFQYVGFILELLPDAKIIHTRRHPLDTCLSCYFQNFSQGQDYSFDLTALAHVYRDYRRLMEHWEQVYPGRILTLDYECLIDEQEHHTRALIDFVDLDWEDSCLAFHETERVVKTASFMQVRQPLYSSSKARWRNYEAQLADLARIIDGVPGEGRSPSG